MRRGPRSWKFALLGDIVNRLPPIIVRIQAREHGKPLDNEEIARRAGMTVQRLVRIYTAWDWNGVSLGEVDRVRAACGVTLRTQYRILGYIKRTLDERKVVRSMKHLRLMPKKKRDRLLKHLRNRMQPQPQNENAGNSNS